MKVPSAVRARFAQSKHLVLAAVYGESSRARVRALSVEGGLVFAASVTRGTATRADQAWGEVWDEASGKRVAKLRDVANGVLSATAPRLVTAPLFENRLSGWCEVPAKKPSWTTELLNDTHGSLGALTLARSGSTLFTGAHRVVDTFKQWKLSATNAKLVASKKEGPDNSGFAAAFSHSGQWLATGVEASLKLWTADGKKKAQLDFPQAAIQALAWSEHDEHLLVTLSRGKTELRLIRAPELKLEREIAGKQYNYPSVASLPGGGFAAAGGDARKHALEVFDAKCRLLERLDLKGLGKCVLASFGERLYVGTSAGVVLALTSGRV